MNYSNRIKELRLEKGMTQKELAGLLDLTPNSICEWEKGRSSPNIDLLIKLSEIFEVSIDYIIGLEDDGTLNYSFTEQDKTAGVRNCGTKLSDAEWEILELFSELKRTKGEKAVKAVITMLKSLIESEK